MEQKINSELLDRVKCVGMVNVISALILVKPARESESCMEVSVM